MRQKQQVFVVIGVGAPEGLGVPGEDLVTLKRVVGTRELAEREVNRLRRINTGQPCRFFWQEWTLGTPGN